MPTGVYKRTAAHYPPERNKKISMALRGKKKSPEHALNIGLGHKGKEIPEHQIKLLRKLSIERFKTNKNWGFKKGHGNLRDRLTPKGTINKAEYQRLHRWVKKNLGTPTRCEHCGIDNLFSRQINWASKSRLYKWDLTDWIRLCIKCHAKYDG